jgi:hypothetical protein
LSPTSFLGLVETGNQVADSRVQLPRSDNDEQVRPLIEPKPHIGLLSGIEKPKSAVCSCPERAQQTSPGQRPGKRRFECVLALKGLNNTPARRLLRPFRARILFDFFSQGVALGYIVPAFQAEDEDRKTIYGQEMSRQTVCVPFPLWHWRSS